MESDRGVRRRDNVPFVNRDDHHQGESETAAPPPVVEGHVDIERHIQYNRHSFGRNNSTAPAAPQETFSHDDSARESLQNKGGQQQDSALGQSPQRQQQQESQAQVQRLLALCRQRAPGPRPLEQPVTRDIRNRDDNDITAPSSTHSHQPQLTDRYSWDDPNPWLQGRVRPREPLLPEGTKWEPRVSLRTNHIDMELSTDSPDAVAAAASPAEARKLKKKKVLLMGKSGSGKSSMRSIIFSNYMAKDTRKLAATIDVDLSHVKFLGNLTLNLWDCGGQDAFMENYLSQQRAHVFANVGVLIYVFDVESRDFDRDLSVYRDIIMALAQFSPASSIYVLIHKMDLLAPHVREDTYDARVASILDKSEQFTPIPFATSIWDQSLYKAWAEIVHDLVPNLAEIETHLQTLGAYLEASEVLLFERTSFLVVSSWSSSDGVRNPIYDRFERLSNIIKNFKQSAARYTSTAKSSEQFIVCEFKLLAFSAFVVKFTTNTYLSVVLPPGEARYNCALENAREARREFESLDSPPRRGVERAIEGEAA